MSKKGEKGKPSGGGDAKSRAVQLAAHAAALDFAPADVPSLVRVIVDLEVMGNKSLTAKGWEALTVAAREDGQFALSAFAAAALDELGDRKGSAAACAELARLFGKDGKRVEGAIRPPTPPKKTGTMDALPALGDLKGAAGNDPQAAMKAAGDAIAKTLAAAQDRAKQAKPLPAVPLVAMLDEATLAKLIDLMAARRKKPGETVVDEGDDATALFVVARGTLTVSRKGEELSRLGPGAFFGEIALLSGARRTAKVVADSDTWLLEVPRDALEAAAAKVPALADVLARHARSRLLANTMRTSEIFKRLEVVDRDLLMPRFEHLVAQPGDEILAAGEDASALHVIVSGEVDVKSEDGSLLAQLEPGDVFGEMSLVGRRPAVADVIARSRVVMLCLGRESFDDVAQKHPELLAEVFKLLVEREQQNKSAVHHEIEAEDIVV